MHAKTKTPTTGDGRGSKIDVGAGCVDDLEYSLNDQKLKFFDQAMMGAQ